MPMHDIKTDRDFVQSIPPLVRTAAGTGARADLQGYNGAMFLWNVGTSTATIGTSSMNVQEGTDGTNYSDIGTADLDGTFPTITGTAQLNQLYRVGYKGDKQYVRMIVNTDGTINVAGTVVRAFPAQRPLA